jgi:hypothetical protein
MYKDMRVETRSQREYVDEVIKTSDVVRIAYSLDDHYCSECDYEIGMDDEMWEYEGAKLTVRRINRGWEHLNCGAKVFTSDGWMWSTCWIDRYYPDNPPQPRWQI